MKARSLLLITILALSFLASCASPAVPEGSVETEPVIPVTIETALATPVTTETEAPVPPSAAPDTVAILVVDAFAFGTMDADFLFTSEGTQVTQTPEPIKLPEDGNCLTNPDGFGTYASRPTSLVVVGKSHGEAVSQVIVDELTGNGWAEVQTWKNTPSDSTPDDSWFKATRFTLGEKTILLVGIDTQAYASDIVARNLGNTVNILKGPNNPFDVTVDKIVVNMSFGVVPCEVLMGSEEEMLAEYSQLTGSLPLDRLQERLKDLYENPAAPDNKNIAQVFWQNRKVLEFYESIENNKEVFIGDALYTVITETMRSFPDIIFVGAAGNAGIPFPFIPARWDFVVSVSARCEDKPDEASCRYEDVGAGGPLAYYSNHGEIQEGGQYVVAGQPVEGTSFAAPRFSLYTALGLLDDTFETCLTDLPEWENNTAVGALADASLCP